MTISSLVRQHLRQIQGYKPGEQPPSNLPVIKLNTNENPYPPSPKVQAALQNMDLDSLRRYPDASAREFREAASSLLGLPPDWFSVGNGSDHLLSLIMQAFVDPGDRVSYPWPTYVLYKTLAELQNAIATSVNFSDTFELPLEELIAAQAKVTFIASPASPSGTAIPQAYLHRLAQSLSGILVIDEAYIDFAEEPALDLVQQYERVIILRTLSKGYSLAGLRLGFAIAHPNVIQVLNKVKDSYSVDTIACKLGVAALLDQEHKDQNAERVRRSRQSLSQQLGALGCDVWPSVTNFIWVKPPCEAKTLTKILKQRHIYIRHFDLPGLNDKVRISVGTDEQHKHLFQALSDIF